MMVSKHSARRCNAAYTCPTRRGRAPPLFAMAMQTRAALGAPTLGPQIPGHKPPRRTYDVRPFLTNRRLVLKHHAGGKVAGSGGASIGYQCGSPPRRLADRQRRERALREGAGWVGGWGASGAAPRAPRQGPAGSGGSTAGLPAPLPPQQHARPPLRKCNHITHARTRHIGARPHQRREQHPARRPARPQRDQQQRGVAQQCGRQYAPHKHGARERGENLLPQQPRRACAAGRGRGRRRARAGRRRGRGAGGGRGCGGHGGWECRSPAAARVGLIARRRLALPPARGALVAPPGGCWQATPQHSSGARAASARFARRLWPDRSQGAGAGRLLCVR